MVLSLFRRDKIYSPSEQLLEYTIEKVLGEGRYGICYQVSRGQEQFILKQLKGGMLKKAGAKAHYEGEILQSLQHPSIPRFIARLEEADFHGYVLELKSGRTFEDIIYRDNHIFTSKEIAEIGWQIIGIVKYLNAQGVVHRDIRVPNTLYDGQRVNLIDFGLARWINNEKYKADMDFAFLGDFLLHLYYTSFNFKENKERPWYEELELTAQEMLFLKKLMGIEPRYESIGELETDFNRAYQAFR